MRGGPPGNLYVVLDIRPHHHFRREDNNVLLELDINVAQAALGDKVKVPTLDGEEELAVPAGTQTGETFRLRGRGVPYLRRNGRGDQLVIIHVLTPTRLTAEQKDLFAELGETLGKEVVHQPEKGLFSKLKDALGL
jgi:molecular chaperone DnaJ